MEPAQLPAVLETPRLILRPFRWSDVPEVLAYAQDPEWSRYLHVLPSPYTEEDAGRFVARQLLLDPVTQPAWAMELDGRVVGGINLRFLFPHRLGELGYSLARGHWNQGYMSEAAGAVLHAAFHGLPLLNRIRAMADVRNAASRRVLEKLGFTLEGILRQNRMEREVVMDEAWYGILREEWEAR